MGSTYPITCIAFGDFSGDGHPDFAYSNSNSQIVPYNVTYGSQGWIGGFQAASNITWSGTIQKIQLADMTGDGRADLVVLAGGRIWIYDLKYTVDPVLKQYQWKALYKVSEVGQVGTKDFDIEDMNRDGRLDILNTGTSRAFGASVGVNVNLYEPASYNYVFINEAASGYIPRMEYGTHNNTVVDTQSVNNFGIKFEETTSGGFSRVSGIMKFDQLSTSAADQILRVVAMVTPGPSTSESFYVWVSPDDTTYSYVGEVSSSTFHMYNYTLPASVVGKEMYVKFTDSLASEDSVVDIIEIDYCAVVTTTPGYTGYSVTTTTTWTSVRAAEINDPQESGGWFEVVVAKDGANGIRVFKRTTGWLDASWNPRTGAENTTFYDDCAGKVNDATKYPFSTPGSDPVRRGRYQR